ncbi:MAG: ECF transporter S component [Clostridia bacterium]|nr:ECF transporter S component [Clostridia bacterium]
MNSEHTSRGNTSLRIRRMVYAALYLAIAMVLPLIILRIPEIGKALSPMHIPVLLCGFMCGWPWGMAVGFIAPILASAAAVMPQPLIPNALAMSLEMAVYGAMTGWLYTHLPNKKWALYATLVSAMLVGRLVWGVSRAVLSGLAQTPFGFEAFIAGAFVNAVPGIILHIALIPVLVMAMERAGLSLNRKADH